MPTPPWLRRWFLFCGAWLLAVCAAHAHDPFQSWSSVRLRDDHFILQTTLAPNAALDLLDRESELPLVDPARFETYKPLILRRASELFLIGADEQAPLVPTDATVRFTEEEDIQFTLTYPRPDTGGRWRFQALYVDRLPDHVGTLFVEDENKADLGWAEFTPGNNILEVVLPPRLSAAGEAGASAPPPTSQRFRQFLKLGVEHILIGYDHLLFLAGLLIACRRFASMAVIITCFTLAHSLTLALAALDLFSLPGEIVEPLIAASIVYVGVENLLRRGEPKGRWALTFVFGLIHGFGFAGVLKQIGLGSSGSGLLVPLFSFNLGVELGQIALAAVFLPLLLRLRRWPAFERHGPRALSVLVALMGTYWLLQRTVFS